MLRRVTGRTEPQLPRKLLIFCLLVGALLAAAAVVSAQPAGPMGQGDGSGVTEPWLPPDVGPMVSVPPARFAGWFQPWVLALMVGLPVLAALIERRKDVARWLRRKDWGRRTGADD